MGRRTTIRDILKAALVPAMIAAAGLSAPAANAAPILDQSQTNDDFVHFLDPTTTLGQTFTVGIAGVLERIDVQLRKTFPGQGPAPDYDIEMTLQSLSGGLPSGTVLASATVDGNTLPAAGLAVTPMTMFDISGAGINVSIGDMFAIVLTAQGTGSEPGDWNIFVSSGSGPDLYTGGNKLQYGSSGWFATSNSSDWTFQTFVSEGEVVAASEPASMAVVAVGLAGLLLVRRRKPIH